MKTSRIQKITMPWLAVALGLCLFVASAALAQQEKLDELNLQTMKLRHEGKYAEATSIAEQALNVAERTFGPDSAYVARSLNSLAHLYIFQRKYSEAEPLFKRSLAIWEKTRGPDDPAVAYCLKNLAALYRKMGNQEEASKLEERVQKIKSQSGSP
jgi:tetratricopeptide (TPR) repeat protein